jgi:voltage-gated potassium channel
MKRILETSKEELYEIIFEADTREGKIFDVILMIVILLSILLVILESVPQIDEDYHGLLRVSEWVITTIFTLEYIVRIWVVKRPWKYVFSFYGIIDLLAVLPTYLSLIKNNKLYFTCQCGLYFCKTYTSTPL